MSSLSLSDYALRRVPKNRAHRPRTSPGFRSIMLFSQNYCELSFRMSCVLTSLIALAQTLPHTLNACFKEPFIGIVADPMNARVFSPDSSHQLTVLSVSYLPLPECSSRDHRHTGLSFFLGISPPSPPRQPGRLQWPNSLCCLQYVCRKSLPIINTAAAWGKRPEVDSDHCRYFLAQMGAIRQSSPVDRRRSLCPPHRSVATEATNRFHMLV